MVVVPAGSFQMGLAKSERQVAIQAGGVLEYEGDRQFVRAQLDTLEPQHRVNIGYSFAVGKYEVTYDEWDVRAASRLPLPGARRRWFRRIDAT